MNFNNQGGQVMNEKELKLCDEKWRGEFVKIILTGEASEEFLAHLKNCPVCQEVVETVLEKQSEATARDFEALEEDMRGLREEMRRKQKLFKKQMLYLITAILIVAGLLLPLFCFLF